MRKRIQLIAHEMNNLSQRRINKAQKQDDDPILIDEDDPDQLVTKLEKGNLTTPKKTTENRIISKGKQNIYTQEKKEEILFKSNNLMEAAGIRFDGCLLPS